MHTAGLKFINKTEKKSKRKKGFTLSEVLITLAIIGIVATLTIPSLMVITQDNHYKTECKKALADGSSAFVSAKSNEEIVIMPSKFDVPAARANWAAFKSKFIVIKACESGNNGSCWDQSGEKVYMNNQPTLAEYAFIDNKGRHWSMYASSESIVLCDTNGFAPPNQYGKDRWAFAFMDYANIRSGEMVKFAPLFNYDMVAVNTGWCPSGNCYYLSWLTN